MKWWKPTGWADAIAKAFAAMRGEVGVEPATEMANFETARKRVMLAEGGYQANPNDSGNYNSRGQLVGTNWGVSAPVYEAWIGRAPSVADMKAMSQNTAIQIYRTRYWDRIMGDAINNQAVADIFLDGAINHGVTTAVKMMQRVLGVLADGNVGAITINALNTLPAAQVYNGFKKAREDKYYQIVRDNPSQNTFLTGWLNRLAKFDDFGTVATASGLILAFVLLGILIFK